MNDAPTPAEENALPHPPENELPEASESVEAGEFPTAEPAPADALDAEEAGVAGDDEAVATEAAAVEEADEEQPADRPWARSPRSSSRPATTSRSMAPTATSMPLWPCRMAG